MNGEIYRIVFGKKTITEVESSEKLKMKPNTIVQTQESVAGDDIIRHSQHNLSVTGIKSSSNGSAHDSASGSADSSGKESSDDFVFTEIGNYSLSGVNFDYQVIPTLNGGPVSIRTFATPINIFTLKGYLADDFVKSSDVDDYDTSEAKKMEKQASNVKVIEKTNSQRTISL